MKNEDYEFECEECGGEFNDYGIENHDCEDYRDADGDEIDHIYEMYRK